MITTLLVISVLTNIALGVLIMATIATIQSAQSAQTQLLVELAARIQGGMPSPTAVPVEQADLDAIQASLDAANTTISNLAPPKVP